MSVCLEGGGRKSMSRGTLRALSPSTLRWSNLMNSVIRRAQDLFEPPMWETKVTRTEVLTKNI